MLSPDKHSTARIAFLDGLRGVAILLVLLAHAAARSPLAQYFDVGRIGVQIFFVISGFVIFMSLEKCPTFSQFIFKRWIRLFPAMLFCAVAIFVSAPLFLDRPLNQPRLESLLPSLTFIDSVWWKGIVGHYVWPVEFTFWTLFVEFKFYVFSAIFYYLGGVRIALVMLAAAFSASILEMAVSPTSDPSTVRWIFRTLSFEHFGWFTCGALLYRLTKQQSLWDISGVLAVGTAAALYQGVGQGPVWIIAVYLGIVATFTVAVLSTRVQSVLSSPPLLFFGFISYPLYLVHENMMVSMTIGLTRILGGSFFMLSYAIPMLVVIAIAYFVAKYIEPWIRDRIRIGISKLQASARSNPSLITATEPKGILL